MYPILIDCRVRGVEVEGGCYLQQYRTGDEFVLNLLQAHILQSCTGEHDIRWLAKTFGQSAEDIMAFLAVLQQAGLVEIENRPTPVFIPSLTRDPYLREVHIDATGWCNLFGKCKHCYGRKTFQETTRKQLTTKEMFCLFQQLGQMNVANCVLSGGEIFIRKDLPLLISFLAEQKIYLAGIFTNGTLYREDVVEILRKERMETRFLVSLDGHTPEINDFMRGKGSFQKTMEFIRLIHQAGFSVTINTMVIKQNVKHLVDMAHFLEDLGMVDLWRLSVPREQGETIVNKDLILPNWEDVFTTYEKLIRYAIISESDMRYQVSSIFKSALLEEPIYYLFRPASSCCEYKRNSITVKPDGLVTPCTAFDNLILGDVRQTSLSNIWYSDLTQSFKLLPVEETECRSCELIPYCGGGCRKVAWEMNGTVLARDDSSCLLYRFAKDVVEPILREQEVIAELLETPKAYRFDAHILDKVILI